jgi:hypothetical protein
MGDQLQRLRPFLPWLGFLLVAALSVPPLLVAPPVDWVAPSLAGARVVVVLAMLGVLAVRAYLDRRDEPHALALALLFAALAGAMTAWHWGKVDRAPLPANWQRETYLAILNHTMDPPHQFRPLPYGFTRSLEWVTGDWLFSCLAYRWFFTYWFLWCSHRFARLFLGRAWALAALVPVVLLYPLSVWYYWGQLTDPLNHALFLLALIYVIQDRWLALAAALALAVAAKETAVLVVPTYFLCACYAGLMPLFRAAESGTPLDRLEVGLEKLVAVVGGKTAVLGAACVAAFLAVRLPLGWRPGNESMNGLPELMIGTNLGIGTPLAHTFVPLYQNYLHPALFVGAFLPPIIWGWRRIDGRLKVMCLTLTPLLLVSNLCFGWMYESRNYMPLVPVLATAALYAVATPERRPQPSLA